MAKADKQVNQVARAFIRRAAEETPEEALAPLKEVAIGRLLDLGALVIAYDAYQTWLSGAIWDPALKPPKNNPVLAKGQAVLHRYAREMAAAIQQHFAPLMDRPDTASFRTLLVKAQRTGAVEDMAVHQSQLLKHLLPWARQRPAVFSSIFSGSRVTKAARALAALCDEESVEGTLNKVASVAPVSGITMPRKWILAAATAAGVSPSAVETAMSDAETAQNLGEDLQTVEGKLGTSTPNTPEAAVLEAKKADILNKIDRTVKQSASPATVLSVAATAAKTQSKASVASRFNLTDEQEAVMRSTGKIIVGAGAGSGKCIKLDTPIRTLNGILPLRDFGVAEMSEGQTTPLVQTIYGCNGPEETSHLYRDGFKKTLKVTTHLGYSLEGTVVHPVLVLRDGIVDWVKLGDLTEGDYICIDRRPGLFPETSFLASHSYVSRIRQHRTLVPESLTPQVASLLGYIVSEGCTTAPRGIRVTTTDPAQRDLYLAAAVGIITNPYMHDVPARNGGLPQFELHINHNADVKALLDFGLTQTLAHEKEIPHGILQSPRPVVRAFVRALFDGDGWFSGSTVGYGTASPVLAHQLHHLLLSFGIVAMCCFKPNASRGCWEVLITGDNARTFMREIGFNLERKQMAAGALMSLKSNPNIDVIPGLSDLCASVRLKYKETFGTTHFNHPQYGTFKGYLSGRREPSHAALRDFLDLYKVDCLEWNVLDRLSSQHWFYDPVDVIEESEAEVGDFVVPGSHSFSAGGFICHNTQTLVATIAHLTEDKGVTPGRILACSFTRAAASELDKRVSDAGVHGADIGTTHHVAREIIFKNRPDLTASVRKTKDADKCFKIAMKQIKMNVADFQQAVAANKEVFRRIESISGWRGIDILKSFHDQLSRGRALSEKQLAVIQKFEGGGRRRWAAPPAPAQKALSQYWTVPIGQWFNIGKPIVDGDGKEVGPKKALLMVDNFKNANISVEAARKDLGDVPVVALYACYEWLKKNDPVLSPAMDYTDQLQVALEILKTDPKALAAEQSRYDVVMVDEAQDLNDIQFEMFRLIGDKAKILSFIGDDKQSIYAFRGAKPQNYVDLSRDPNFTTRLMTTNFRSGEAIVNAANKLISHNGDRQIPMVCRAYEKRGKGAIKAKVPETHEAGASQVAQEISDAVDAGESASDFGVLVRNNAEADAYTLSLIGRGVPYRMLKRDQGGYFGRPVVKALTAWVRLILGGSDEEMNDAFIEAHRTPGYGLDEALTVNCGREVKGSNYYDWAAAGKPIYTGNAAWLNKRVAEYVNAVQSVRSMGLGDSAALLRSILDQKGPKGSFVDALMKLVDEDDLSEDELEGGEEAIKNAALAPVRPLMLMAEKFSDPANLLRFIQKMKGANEKVQKKDPTDKDDWKEPAVLVGTTHGWKGLQAKHVYVCMAGGVFPNYRSALASATDPTALDEERRLAYVAITRGADTTTVISPKISYLGKPAAMSLFVNEACIPVAGEPEPQEEFDRAVAEAEAEAAMPKTAASAEDSADFAESMILSLEDDGHSEAEF